MKASKVEKICDLFSRSRFWILTLVRVYNYTFLSFEFAIPVYKNCYYLLAKLTKQESKKSSLPEADRHNENTKQWNDYFCEIPSNLI
jgi:hypothetical protein